MKTSIFLMSLLAIVAVSCFQSSLGLIYDGQDVGFSSETGQSQHIFEKGKVMYVEKIVYPRSIPEFSNGTLSFDLVDKEKNILESISSSRFEIRRSTEELFSTDFTPNKVGQFGIYGRVEHDSTGGQYASSVDFFYVVEKYSKTYKKNIGCSDDFMSVIKPNYSTVVCVKMDTKQILNQRGWH